MKNISIKDFFNKGLYKEGLKQLKNVGILAMVLISVIAAAIPIETAAFEGGKKAVVIAAEINPLMILCFLVVAPLMTLKIFSFLNKRNASDLYHSLPHKRECIFISYMASVLTWIAIIIASTMGVSIIFTSLFPNLFVINFNTVLTYVLNTFAGSFMVSAAIAIAMSVSGNSATNVMVSGLILFMPRFAMLLIRDAVLSSTPLLSGRHFLPLFRNGYNILTSTVALDTDIMMSWHGFVYTFCLALVYSVIGCFLFKRRKSESAGHSAPNRTLQAVFRITLTMVFCLCICWMLVVGEQGVDMAIILFALALLVYFGYELVTTKKWGNLLKIFPGLGIVIVCNVIVLLFMTNIGNAIVSNVPAADEIEGVALVESGSGHKDSISLYEYHMLGLGGRLIKDDKLIEDIAGSLANCVDVWENKGSSAYEDHFEFSNNRGVNQEITVKLKLKDGSTIYRNIYVSKDIADSFAEKIADIDISEHGNVITELPPHVPGTCHILSRRMLHSEQMEEIFKSYNDEIKEISPSIWLDIVVAGRYGYIDNSVATLRYTTIKGNDSYEISLPISAEVTPKTADLLYKYMSEISAKDKGGFVDAIEFLKSKLPEGSMKEYSSLALQINITVKAENGKTYVKTLYPPVSYGQLTGITESDLDFCLNLVEEGTKVAASAQKNVEIWLQFYYMGDAQSADSRATDMMLVIGVPDNIDLSGFSERLG